MQDQEARFYAQLSFEPRADSQQEKEHIAVLEIFERNEFRNLLHLRLAMVQATAEDACKHLSKKLLVQKRVNIEQQSQIEEQSEKMEQDEEMLQQLQGALQKLKADNDIMLEQKDDEFNGKIREME